MKKIALLLVCTMVMVALWLGGLESLYGRMLTLPANVVLGVAGQDARISVEKENDAYQFRVERLIEGRQAAYPQRFQTILYPTIMVLAWQVFLAFALGFRSSLRVGKISLGVFVAIQVVFLLLLYGYHTASLARFFYDLLRESFFVLALAVIIIDNLRHPHIFTKPQR